MSFAHVVVDHTGDRLHLPQIEAIFSRQSGADDYIAQVRNSHPDRDLRYQRHYVRRAYQGKAALIGRSF